MARIRRSQGPSQGGCSSGQTVVPAGTSVPGRKSKKNLRIAGPENTVRIEARVSFSSRGCSHPGLELYHWFPTCQVTDVKLLKCLCPCQQQTSNGELLSGSASEKQEKLQWHRAGGSRFSYQTALPLTQKLFIASPTSPPPSSSQRPAGDRRALPLKALPAAILLLAHHSPESLASEDPRTNKYVATPGHLHLLFPLPRRLCPEVPHSCFFSSFNLHPDVLISLP